MQTRTESITSPSGPMGVYVVRPDGEGPFPVVVSFHHGPGLDDGDESWDPSWASSLVDSNVVPDRRARKNLHGDIKNRSNEG